MISLDKLKKSKDTLKNKKRIGRGNASGMGTYSGKGQKGQRSRSGVSRLKLKKIGMKHGRSVFRGVPKLRGFKSMKPKNQVVNLSSLSQNYKDGEKVNPETLLEKGLIAKINLPVKILGNGTLKVKNLEFRGVKMSETAKKQIG